MYTNYNDYRNDSNAPYSMTARINRSPEIARKFMEELQPVNDEMLTNFYTRTEIAEKELVSYGIHQHLYGTKRVWSCHTSSRYCFICTKAQYIDIHRSINTQLLKLCPDLQRVRITLTVVNNEVQV